MRPIDELASYYEHAADQDRFPQLQLPEKFHLGIEEHRPLPDEFAELAVIVADCLQPDPRARPVVGELADRLDWLAEDDEES